MGQGYVYVFLVSVLLALSAAAKNSSKKKSSFKKISLPFQDRPCGQAMMEHRCLHLACKPGHVIFDIDVIALQGSNCSGKTGGLIKDTAQCFWKPECHIQFPRERMLVGLFEGDWENGGGCVYQRPEAINVSNIQCVKYDEAKPAKSEIVDICNGTNPNGTNPKRRQGVIRSHPNYPWIHPRENGTDNVMCSLQLNRQSKNNVYITVLHVDQVECDSLIINGEEVNTTKSMNFNVPVTITFTKCPLSRASGSGLQFIVCFKEKQTGKGISDVCKAISRRSKKKLSIEAMGPATKNCVLEKDEEKKRNETCCCGLDHCDHILKLAGERKTEWEKCNRKQLPCECRPLKARGNPKKQHKLTSSKGLQ